MALPILDGNQTAATLSTIVTSGEHTPAHTVVSLGSQAIIDMRSAVSGSVVSISNFPASQSTTFGAVTGSVSVLNFPSTQTVAGTVTANLKSDVYDGSNDWNLNRVALHAYTGGDEWQAVGSGNISLPISGTVTVGNTVTIGSLPAISGTVTAKLDNDNFSGALTSYIETSSSHNAFPVEIAYQPSVTIGSLPAISGTVTANYPNGALTTRFGSVTTANLSQITTAVTNTSRKYLLAQNISAGTVTIGIGFSPTTTQGIQLTAGAGLTFDAFCPTGAVYWLGAVTGAAFTILEG